MESIRFTQLSIKEEETPEPLPSTSTTPIKKQNAITFNRLEDILLPAYLPDDETGYEVYYNWLLDSVQADSRSREKLVDNPTTTAFLASIFTQNFLKKLKADYNCETEPYESAFPFSIYRSQFKIESLILNIFDAMSDMVRLLPSTVTSPSSTPRYEENNDLKGKGREEEKVYTEGSIHQNNREGGRGGRGGGGERGRWRGREGGSLFIEAHQSMISLPSTFLETPPRLRSGLKQLIEPFGLDVPIYTPPSLLPSSISSSSSQNSDCLLFHCTRYSSLGQFFSEGINPQFRPNELFADAAFYLTNSWPHGQLHVMSVKPKVDEVDPVIWIVFKVNWKVINGFKKADGERTKFTVKHYILDPPLPSFTNMVNSNLDYRRAPVERESTEVKVGRTCIPDGKDAGGATLSTFLEGFDGGRFPIQMGINSPRVWTYFNSRVFGIYKENRV